MKSVFSRDIGFANIITFKTAHPICNHAVNKRNTVSDCFLNAINLT